MVSIYETRTCFTESLMLIRKSCYRREFSFKFFRNQHKVRLTIYMNINEYCVTCLVMMQNKGFSFQYIHELSFFQREFFVQLLCCYQLFFYWSFTYISNVNLSLYIEQDSRKWVHFAVKSRLSLENLDFSSVKMPICSQYGGLNKVHLNLLRTKLIQRPSDWFDSI